MESQTQYPPISENQLPQWTRVGQLDKSRYPKAFTRDQYALTAYQQGDADTDDIEYSDQTNPALTVQYLERSIKFLKSQHQDVLRNLHTEIEKLRSENKELHFKLVMSHGESRAENSEQPRSEGDPEGKELDLIDTYIKERTTSGKSQSSARTRNRLLEKQVSDLHQQLRDLKHKNEYLTQLADKTHDSPSTSNTQNLPLNGNTKRTESAHSASISEINFNLENMTFLPNLKRSVIVQDRLGSAKRSANQEELERIVAHLHKNNQQLQNELDKVKSDLREVLYSHKWTPDAYLLAKAYVADDGVPVETDILPKLQMRSTTRKLPEIAYISRDNASLPALKNTMGSKAVERRKRTQILQKARLHKEVL